MLYCDVDGFKDVNDRWGHETGDRLLCQIAAGLRAATREIDTVSRFAGDEFVVVCPGLVEADDLEVITERIQQILALADPLQEDLGSLHLTPIVHEFA